jgi:uncharacterized membrane protein YphA (DoxX/SURF4 family)
MKKIITFLGLFILPLSAFAHVRYVLEENVDYHTLLGNNWQILKSGMTNTGFLIGTIVSLFIVGVIVELAHTKIFKKYFDRVKGRLSTYHELIPWIIRLCLGIALIGAGGSHFHISPIMTTTNAIATLETFLGFFFLAGFLLVPSTIVAIILYITGLAQDTYFLGNLDFLALSIGLLVFHSSRPGVDDVLGICLLKYIPIPRKYLALILRIGVGAAMMYLGLFEKILNPLLAEHVVTEFNLTSVIPVTAATWALATGIIETVLGFIIAIGLFTRTAAVVGILVISITFFFFNEAVFSHVTLFGILSILAIEGGSHFSFDQLIKNRKYRKLQNTKPEQAQI